MDGLRHSRLIWLGRDQQLLEQWLAMGGPRPEAVCGMAIAPQDLLRLAPEALPQAEKRFDGVILAPDFDPCWLDLLEKTSLSIWALPANAHALLRWSTPCQDATALLSPVLVSPVGRRSFRYGKRGLDIAVALIGLVVSLPLWLLIAPAVKIASPGPVLYSQQRVGLRGRPFKLYKFRTMPVDADAVLVWGESERKTVSTVGRMLRRSGLDELPQLINILKGDMSLVGPRPERVEFVTSFSEQVPYYMQRHMVPPGVTGWAQIHGWRGDTPLEPRIEHDLWYIAHWSLWLDLRIVLKTVPYVIKVFLPNH